MKTNRPRIKIPFQSIDIFIELLSVTLILLMWIYVSLEYSNLPETIASHFNAKGEADKYSNKTSLWILISISTALYIGLFILNMFPHLHKYMVNITEDNALRHYKVSTRFMRITNFLCIALFAYISYTMIKSARGIDLSLGPLFIPIVIGVSTLLTIIVFIYQQKNK